MKNSFFDKRDPWGHGMALWVVVLLVFLAPLAISSLWGLRMQNDVDSWLPDHDEQARIYRWCREQFPEQEQVVMTWEGSAVGDPRLPLLVGRLQGKVDADGVRRGGLPYVESVLHGEALLRQMLDLGIEQDEAVRRLDGILLGSGWLKVELSASGREEKDRTIRDLQRHLKQALKLDVEVGDPAQIWQPTTANESLFDHALEAHADFGQSLQPDADVATEAAERPLIEFPAHDFQLRWDGMAAQPEQVVAVREALLSYRGFATSSEPAGRQLVADCFQSPGAPLGVLVTLSSAGVADKPGALAAIREAAQSAFIPAESLWIGGSVAAESELNAGVLRAAWDPAVPLSEWYRRSVIGLSGLVGIFFALVSLRSVRLGLLVVFVSYYAALLGLALVPLSGGTMNMVLVVMPTLLMVLSLSGAIHVANYWKHAVWEEPATAVTKAIEMARVPCLMAAITTALGLISLCTSELKPVRAFGLYAALGSIISVVMVLYGLPALLQMSPLRRVRPDDVNPRRWLWFGAFICRHAGKISLSYIAITLACTAGLYWFRTETKVIRYFQSESRLAQDYQHIEDSLTGITPLEVIVSFDRESQTRYPFLQRMEILREVEEQVRQHREIRGALSLASFQPVRTPPGENSNTRERIFYNRRSNETERRIKSGEIASAASFIATVPGELAPTEKDGWAESGAEIWRINAQASALGDNTQEDLTGELDMAVREVTRLYPGTQHVVTGAIPLFNRTQQAVLESLIFSFALAFGMIAVVMMVVLGDPVAGAMSMIPNILPVVSIFGLVSWCGARIDVGTMVTASVALGIAVDGTLHLLTWFLNGLRKGYSREKSIMLALSHCGPAMWQTSAAVGIGLLVLLPAELLLISRFGWLMAALIGSALVGDLLLLPAMLMGWMGVLLEHRIKRQLPPRAEHPPTSETSTAPETSTAAENPRSTIIPAPHIGFTGDRQREAQRRQDHAADNTD